MSRLETADRMAWALRSSGQPALFLALQDDLSDRSALTISTTVFADTTLGDPLEILAATPEPTPPPSLRVYSGFLSSSPPELRSVINARRSRFLALPQRTLFVEPAAKEAEIRRDFPDVLSVVRETFRLETPLLEDDWRWNTGGGGLEAVARALPEVVTVGATLIVKGRVHRKAGNLISCPRCGTPLRPGTTEIVFANAPLPSRTQRVEALVCKCGEAYVPGGVARAAHERAFGLIPGRTS